jgi:beta-N-acetylhexosaminidase
MRFRPLALAGLACLLPASGGAPAVHASALATPSWSQLVGQRLVVAMHGTSPGPVLRARIRNGQIGGVILFGDNITSETQLRSLTSALQAAASAGGQAKLIIATDQEGGLVRRLGWAPPKRSAQEMGQLSASRVESIGAAAGARLRADGINLDLAPVADVPDGSADFIWQQHRAFSTSRYVVARDATTFAQGLEGGQVWPTFKHFPGVGQATVSTDDALVRIGASSHVLLRRLLPYRVALRHSLRPVIMLSTAIYPALDRRAAAWSPPIIRGLLRRKMGFRGVTITDSLDSAAAVRHTGVGRLALRSAAAGADLILITGSARTSSAVYKRLLDAAQTGSLSHARLLASYQRILTLKSRL